MTKREINRRPRVVEGLQINDLIVLMTTHRNFVGSSSHF